MFRALGYAVAASGLFVIGFGLLVRAGLERSWDPAKAYSGRIEDQRHIADCHIHGCPGVERSSLFACAWREVILEETAPASAEDASAAEAACRDLSPSRRQLLGAVEADIRNRLHLKPTKG